MASFDEQKAKYQSVIDVIQREGVSVKNLHQQDGKLFIKGAAPSMDAANKVWDEIKKINPRMDDITAEFPVDESLKPPVQADQHTAAQRPQMCKVKPGDTLSKISKEFYGSANQYMRIFDANKDKLSDPDKIQVG